MSEEQINEEQKSITLIVNPVTKRRIKKNGRVHKKLEREKLLLKKLIKKYLSEEDLSVLKNIISENT